MENNVSVDENVHALSKGDQGKQALKVFLWVSNIYRTSGGGFWRFLYTPDCLHSISWQCSLLQRLRVLISTNSPLCDCFIVLSLSPLLCFHFGSAAVCHFLSASNRALPERCALQSMTPELGYLVCQLLLPHRCATVRHYFWPVNVISCIREFTGSHRISLMTTLVATTLCRLLLKLTYVLNGHLTEV